MDGKLHFQQYISYIMRRRSGPDNVWWGVKFSKLSNKKKEEKGHFGIKSNPYNIG